MRMQSHTQWPGLDLWRKCRMYSSSYQTLHLRAVLRCSFWSNRKSQGFCPSPHNFSPAQPPTKNVNQPRRHMSKKISNMLPNSLPHHPLSPSCSRCRCRPTHIHTQHTHTHTTHIHTHTPYTPYTHEASEGIWIYKHHIPTDTSCVHIPSDMSCEYAYQYILCVSLYIQLYTWGACIYAYLCT